MKGILNQLAERFEAAVDRSRLAALPLRYLDDVGMTVGERAAILGYEEPAHDPWTIARKNNCRCRPACSKTTPRPAAPPAWDGARVPTRTSSPEPGRLHQR